MISPCHKEARKVASVVRERLKAEGAIGLENCPVTILRRMDLGPESCRDLLHYAQQASGKGNTRSRTTILSRCGRSPIPSSSCVTAGECAVMVRASIKASALPLTQASAVRSTRWLCCRTAPMQKPGMSAYPELERQCTSTHATRQSCVNR